MKDSKKAALFEAFMAGFNSSDIEFNGQTPPIDEGILRWDHDDNFYAWLEERKNQNK